VFIAWAEKIMLASLQLAHIINCNMDFMTVCTWNSYTTWRSPYHHIPGIRTVSIS